MKLYWAKASVALGWPAPWDGSVVVPALMGSPIGTQPTGAVPGGSSIVLDYNWSPPNPADYAVFGADQSHFRLLSRIETSPVPPYGMTFPEGPDLGANVRSNNKIVWKNVTVVTSFPRMASVSVGNGTDGPQIGKFTFTLPNEFGIPDIFRWAEITVDLGDELFQKWVDGGMEGAGVIVVDHNTVQVFDGDSYIGNILFNPFDLETIQLHFHPYSTDLQLSNVYKLNLTEIAFDGSTEREVGGEQFIVKVNSDQRP